MTRVLHVEPNSPDPLACEQAGRLLREGNLVAFPTETVYGLGANALDDEAVASIYRAKGRPTFNPTIVHVADVEMARVLAETWPAVADSLAASFWPGPLTLVVRHAGRVSAVATAGGATVALRMPRHLVALRVIKSAGVPVAAPSANRSGSISPTTAEHVVRSLGGRIDLILDSGPTDLGIESTVLDLSGGTPSILRPGHVTKREIERIIGPIADRIDADGGPLRSPGRLQRHYAPNAATECHNRMSLIVRLEGLAKLGARVGVLTCCGRIPQEYSCTLQKDLTMEAVRYAASLYASLQDMDAAGVDHILIELPPTGDSWDAIHDRLRRAAAV